MLQCLYKLQRHSLYLSMVVTESKSNQDHADIQRILHAQQKCIEVLSEILKAKDAAIQLTLNTLGLKNRVILYGV